MLHESLDLVATPLEHSHFETAVMANVNMQRGLREMVVIVDPTLGAGQSQPVFLARLQS
jgi:hypothetical protein